MSYKLVVGKSGLGGGYTGGQEISCFIGKSKDFEEIAFKILKEMADDEYDDYGLDSEFYDNEEYLDELDIEQLIDEDRESWTVYGFESEIVDLSMLNLLKHCPNHDYITLIRESDNSTVYIYFDTEEENWYEDLLLEIEENEKL